MLLCPLIISCLPHTSAQAQELSSQPWDSSQTPSSRHETVRPLLCCSGCQLYQHPLHEAERAEIRHPSDQWKLVRRVRHRCQVRHHPGGGVHDWHGCASYGCAPFGNENTWGRKPFMKWFLVLNTSVLVGLCLVFATHLCCALFPHMNGQWFDLG